MSPFVSIGKITLAAGLKWMPITASKERERKKEIASLSESFSADLIVSLKNPYQIGLANTLSGYKASMLSMAAAVSESVQKQFGVSTFQCAFEIRDGIWGYVAVEDKTILPGITGICGDMIGSEEKVRQMFTLMRSKMAFELEVAPDTWKMDCLDVPFAELLAHRKNGEIIARANWRVRSIKKNDWQKRFLLFACLFLLALIGWYWHHEIGVKHLQAEKKAQQVATRNAKVGHPLKKRASADVFAKACEAAFHDLPGLFPAGWVFNSANCTQGALTLSWNRTSTGTAADLLRLYPGARFSSDGNNAFFELPLSMKTAKDEPLATISKQERAMRQVAGALALTLSIEKGKMGEMPGQKEAFIADGKIKRYRWIVKDSLLSPKKVVAALNAAGLRLIRIQTTMKNGLFVWNLEGEQYGK